MFLCVRVRVHTGNSSVGEAKQALFHSPAAREGDARALTIPARNLLAHRLRLRQHIRKRHLVQHAKGIVACEAFA